METDARNFGMEAALSQLYEQCLHSVACYSRGIFNAEVNYNIHDKEMLAIVAVFKQWRHYLEGAPFSFMISPYYTNLKHFTTWKALNRRHARWVRKLMGYDFKMIHWPGSRNGKPDVLSNCSEYSSEKGGVDDEMAVNSELFERIS